MKGKIPGIWVRREKMFLEEIDTNRKDNITGQKYRFEVVKDLSKDYISKNGEIYEDKF